MPELLYPGVYVEEVVSAATPIAGVGSSTAGFIGEALRGPLRPTLVSSWMEFTRRYGGLGGRAAAAAGPYLPYAVRGFFENGGRRLVVARVAGEAARTASLAIRTASGPLDLAAVGPGAWGNEILVTVDPSTTTPNRFTLTVEYAAFSEVFEDLSADPTHSECAMTVVNRRSELVEIRACPNATPPAVTRAALDGGSDASASLQDYLGRMTGDSAIGLHALSLIGGISIMSAPDDVSVEGLATALLSMCEARRDRFAVTAVPDPDHQAADLRPIRESSWGATYFPWLQVPADHLPAGTRVVPPHGHICGIYARVDTTAGVHKPPSNEELRGIIGLSHAVTAAQQEILNPRGINVIRDFRPQRGMLVWGARTMATGAEWKYVNVRRLFIFIERSIERGLQWVVFEPNAEQTWRKVREAVDTFLTRAWRDGALAGRVAEEAFFVRCDRTTTTAADVQAGRLVCEIGVAPIRPAEFMILRIGLRTADRVT